MNDADNYLRSLMVTNPLREPVLRAIIDELHLPEGSQGLDVGCGIGLQAFLLAEAVGPNGHVTGIDISPEFLEYARELAKNANLSNLVSFNEGDVNKLPFDDNTFDWAWSVDCVGYAPGNTVSSLKELSRVVRPSGDVFIIFWSSQQLLPGYPVLEAKLNSTSSGISPFVKGMSPDSHSMRALRLFREIGLKNPTASTFAGSAYAPLTDEMRSALLALIEMRWQDVKSELLSEEWENFRRLCQPESPDFVLDDPNYYGFFTYSMFRGKIPV